MPFHRISFSPFLKKWNLSSVNFFFYERNLEQTMAIKVAVYTMLSIAILPLFLATNNNIPRTTPKEGKNVRQLPKSYLSSSVQTQRKYWTRVVKYSWSLRVCVYVWETLSSTEKFSSPRVCFNARKLHGIAKHFLKKLSAPKFAETAFSFKRHSLWISWNYFWVFKQYNASLAHIFGKI